MSKIGLAHALHHVLFRNIEVGLGVDEQRSLDLKILSKVEYIYFKKRHRMRFFVIIF